MHFVRIAILGASPVFVQFPLPAEKAGPLQVVVGGNGSGKSLLVAALQAVFSADGERRGLCEDLHAAGVQRIEADYFRRGWMAHVVCQVDIGECATHWERVGLPAAGHHHGSRRHAPREGNGVAKDPPQFDSGELYPKIHLVRSGQLTVGADWPFGEVVQRILRLPLERELAGWIGRQKDIGGGELGQGGKLAVARNALETASAEVLRLETRGNDLEKARERKTLLQAELADAKVRGDVLAAEADELTKICALAERATRIEAWSEEIRQESREVQRLREQHRELQTQLDAVEALLRGLPDHLPELLLAYETARRREAELTTALTDLKQRTDQAQFELVTIRENLAKSSAPIPDGSEEQERLRRDMDSRNSELTALLRKRIELVRQRQGIQQQLRQELDLFARLDDDARQALEELIALGPEGESAADRDAETRALTRRQERLASVERVLSERFAGFERLPAATPELLREWQDMRRVQSTLTSDLEGLRRRVALLKRKAHPVQSTLFSAGAAVAGFVGGAALLGWDVGLFAAVAASGITLLGFRFVHRGVQMETESALAAEAMTLRRWEETRVALARLEQQLGPLVSAGHLEEGVARYHEYLEICRERDELQSKAEFHARRHDSERCEKVAGLLRRLPAALSDLAVPVLQRLYIRWRELEARAAELEKEWNEYEEGGRDAQRLRQLEHEMAGLKRRHSELLSEMQMQVEAEEARRREWARCAAELESRLESSEQIPHLERQLEDAQTAVEKAASESGGRLAPDTVDAIRRAWDEREDHRLRLREIRSALSSRQTHDELRAREALLSEEAAEVRQKITALDPLYLLQGTPAEYSTRFAGQLQAVRDQLASNEREIQTLQAQASALDVDALQDELSRERPLEELRREVEAHRQGVESLERDLTTTNELINSIRAELEEGVATGGLDAASAIDRHLSSLTEGRLVALHWANGQMTVAGADGSQRRVEVLSDGMKDVVWIAIRLGILETVQSCDSCPIVWDEALSRLDDTHRSTVRAELNRHVSARQVILLTRDSSFEAWGTVARLSADPQWSSVAVR